MALADQTWRPVSIHQAYVEFLRAERYCVEAMTAFASGPRRPDDLALIDRPDLNDPAQNRRRWHMLYSLRGGLLREIPPDTQWYRGPRLTRAELGELHVIARCGWDDPAGLDRNRLPEAGPRNRKTLQTPPVAWASPILWGHDRSGPFTIIEGNNRLAGYTALTDPPPLNVPVLIGLSPTPCHYHLFDPPGEVVAGPVKPHPGTTLIPG